MSQSVLSAQRVKMSAPRRALIRKPKKNELMNKQSLVITQNFRRKRWLLQVWISTSANAAFYKTLK